LASDCPKSQEPGQGIVEFKKGLKGIETEVEQSSSVPTVNRPVLTQQAPAYKFDPNTGQPMQPTVADAVPPGAKFDPYTGKPLNSEVVPAGTEVRSSSSVGV